MGDVFSELIGQDRVVATLRRAVAGGSHAMTHAWLFVGPPGSGRSNAARAFAAALQCDRGGCGQCEACRTTVSGAHPDVTLVRTEQLSIGVDEVRAMVGRAGVAPVGRRYQIVVVEDADRMTERAADALLKALEEPSPRTVWLLCAPTPDDVIVTIRSRCRLARLVTPSAEAVAELLVRRDGVDPERAEQAARIAQGHVGRARALARSDDANSRRRDILSVPPRLRTLTDCLEAAGRQVDAAAAEATEITAPLDAKETAALQEALGMGGRGTKPRNAQAALRELEDQQKLRLKRLQRDALDRVLTELTSYFRDVLAVQTGAGAPLINADFAEEIERLAEQSTPEHTVRAIDALLEARTALEGNVAPLLALEAMFIAVSRAVRRS
ncbi:DNA polymerase III subunit delta' [Tessaracoccus sp. HF-7]|nr:DNA polymerase III subunit delta' [Tessaracoccus caeni]MDF1487687.1 DNA polymerase III subunit delta' [Tessaracoccus caeni]